MMSLSSLTGALFFLSLLGYAFGLMLLLPRLKMGAALFSAFCGMLLVAYWSIIILEWMMPTAYALIFGGLLCLLLGLICLAANRGGLRGRVFSLPLWGYLILSMVFVVVSLGRTITDHDSYSFWARAVKELFTFGRSYFNGEANISHTDYNPIFAALQYSIVQVFGWQDAYLFYPIVACILVCLCAISDLLPSKLSSGLFFLLGLGWYLAYFGWTVLTANGPLSIVFVAGLLCLCFRKDGTFVSLFPALCAMAVLPALKLYSGLMFAAVLFGVLLFSTRKKKRTEGIENPLRILPRFVVIGCSVMLLMEFSWSGYYHFQTRKASYEAQLARSAFVGQEPAQEVQPPQFQLLDLVSGNPRNESLQTAVSAESTENVLALIGLTSQLYFKSDLPWALLSLLPLLWVLLKSKKALRSQLKTSLLAVVLAGIVYTLGMFVGFYVQGETAGGSVTYLRVVTLPLVFLALFACLQAAADKERATALPAKIMTALFAISALTFSPWKHFLPPSQPTAEAASYGAYAQDFFAKDVSPWLTPEDENARVVIMDATWDSMEIKSKSGITHAYQYYALPMRLSVYQFECGNVEEAANITPRFLTNAMVNNRATILILRVDDYVYEDAFAEALGLEDVDADLPWVLDAAYEDGEFIFHLRNEAEE